MEEQLDLAPVGYLVMDKNLKIIEMNKMMGEMTNLKSDSAPTHMHSLLTMASRVYFQTYFIPTIITHGAVNEMFLKLKSSGGPIPVLMNTKKRNDLFECAFMQVPVRSEYEKELLNAKQEAERISQATTEANRKLQELLDEVECKQAELNILNERLKEMTITDVLTGLKNRRYLEEWLENFSKDESLALLMIDIDYFKQINDTYGHHTGDTVLKELADILVDVIGDAGFAVRLGGEEFVGVLWETELQEAGMMAEKIRGNIEIYDWFPRPITVSIGVASTNGATPHADLLAEADAALYNSKNKGRNRITLAV